MSAIDEVLRHAAGHPERFRAHGLPPEPARRLAVVTCMDARLNPYELLGLGPGDSHIIRNAGGVVTDEEIRSLAISQHMLGTREVMVIQHTRCGLLTFSDDEFADRMEEATGERPRWRAHAFADLDASVRRAVSTIRESPFVVSKVVRGFVYDVDTGALREVPPR